MKIVSLDGSHVYYEETAGERGRPTLFFVHGWLGNCRWFDAQRDYFLAKGYSVAAMDLPGHGLSSPAQTYSSSQYAAAIRAVALRLAASEVVLVGHSMSGAYVLEASVGLPKTKRIVLIDTLKNLDEQMTWEQAEKVAFQNYREDFPKAVREILPTYLFAKGTPAAVKDRLLTEFLASDGKKAVQLLEPFYKLDLIQIAGRVSVPVRAVNSDATPTAVETNRKYLKDYDCRIMQGTGHYPMLEDSAVFNEEMFACL